LTGDLGKGTGNLGKGKGKGKGERGMVECRVGEWGLMGK